MGALVKLLEKAFFLWAFVVALNSTNGLLELSTAVLVSRLRLRVCVVVLVVSRFLPVGCVVVCSGRVKSVGVSFGGFPSASVVRS